MRLHINKKDQLVVEAGFESEQSELGMNAFGWLVIAVLTLYLAKAKSIGAALLGLVLLSPLFLFGIVLAIPRRYFHTNFLFDRQKSEVEKRTRWFHRRKSRGRSSQDFSALLIVEDRVKVKGVMRPRWRLFLCIGPKMVRRRVVYIDDLWSPEEAADAAKEIGSYMGWPIEFLTLDRTIEETDVDWESW